MSEQIIYKSMKLTPPIRLVRLDQSVVLFFNHDLKM